MLTAATCEEALAASAHVADASKACADLLAERRRLSEDAKFATFDEVQDYVDLACVIVIVACAALSLIHI